MVIFTWGNGKMINLMGMESIFLEMEQFMKESGIKIKSMDMEKNNG